MRGVVVLALVLLAVIVLAATPLITSVTLNNTDSTNHTGGDLTAVPINVTDGDSDPVLNITNFFIDGASWTILFMPFEGGSDTSFTRDYASGNNGTITGSVTYESSSGYDGRGQYFMNADNERISISDIVLNSTDAWTLSFYAQMAVDGQNAECYVIGDNTTAQSSICLDTFFNQVRWTPATGAASAFNIDPGLARHHYALVADGQGALSLYRDGTLFETKRDQPTAWTINSIGDADPGGTNFYNGRVDNVMLFNRALSEQQVSLIYADDLDMVSANETQAGEQWAACVTPNDATSDGATVCSPTMTITNTLPSVDSATLSSTSGNNFASDNITLATSLSDTDSLDTATLAGVTWEINGTPIILANYLPQPQEPNGTALLYDSSSPPNHGTRTNVSYLPEGGPDGQGAYRFMSNNGRFEINQIDFNSTDEWAVMFDARMIEDGQNDECTVLGDKDDVGNRLCLDTFFNRVVLQNSLNQAIQFFYDPGLTYHHYTLTADGLGNTTLYVDGVLFGTVSGEITSFSIDSIGDASSTASAFFNGEIASMRILNRHLTSEQVALWWNQTPTVLHSSMIDEADTVSATVTAYDGHQYSTTVQTANLTIQDPKVIIGREENVSTSGISALDVRIDGNTNLSGGFGGTHYLTFYDGAILLTNLTVQFTQDIDLRLVTINRSTNALIVNASAIAQSKTLFLPVSGLNAACVDNTEISSFDEISAECTGFGETFFLESQCPTTKGDISCVIENGYWRFSGLSNSGASLLSAAVPEFSTIALFGVLVITLCGFVGLRRKE